MEEVFNLEEYKNYLLKCYCFPAYIDRSMARREIEKIEDKHLEQVVNNSRIFCFYLLEKIKEKNQITEDKISIEVFIDDNGIHTFNPYVFGCAIDRYFVHKEFPNDFWISRHLLRNFFREFYIECEDEAKLIISSSIEYFNAFYERYHNEEQSLELKRYSRTGN